MSKERPILFNAEMVKAILDGRKTQTRRIMRRQPDAVERFKHGEETTDTDAQYAVLRCYNNPKLFKGCNSGWFAGATEAYGEFNVGDRLWVREACIISPKNWLSSNDQLNHKDIIKDSDGDNRVVQYLATNSDTDVPLNDFKLKKTPSIHMPRWASRILLEITKIRVERLNDISEVDVVAEGGPKSHPSIDKVSRTCGFKDWSRSWFAHTWDWINGNGAWSQNPWVWVVEFKVVRGGSHGS